MDKLVIFTLDGCYHCNSLKKRLDDINLTYKEIEINQNPEVWSEIVKLTKEELLPTILVCPDDSDDGHIFVPSINYKTEDEIVEIIRNYF